MMSRIHDGDTRLSCHASNLPILRVLAFSTSCAGVAKRLRKALANGPQKVEVQNLGGWLLSLVSQMSQCFICQQKIPVQSVRNSRMFTF